MNFELTTNPYEGDALTLCKDLVAFFVDTNYLVEAEDAENVGPEEVAIIVEKNWLIKRIAKDGITNPSQYLQEEYTSDDSIKWFEDADRENQIISIVY
jgi:hypothetical protein